jgi:predicted nucleotidyltransferase component of viral defense system
MSNSIYQNQVSLLIKVLPIIAAEKVFALKGGTAINLFFREMPRLSVDIDLTYLPLNDRNFSLNDIGKTIKKIKKVIENEIVGAKVRTETVSGIETPSNLIVSNGQTQIKVEVNLLLRGSVYPPVEKELSKEVQNTFDANVSIQCLSLADIYGGKICAALDRQHPRDLFDIKILLENEGLTEDIRKAFVVYLASHGRPMNELLNPNWKDIDVIFKRDFEGMTKEVVTTKQLSDAVKQLHSQLIKDLSSDEKHFLVSMKEGNPEWQALEIKGIENLPGLQWKLKNIKSMKKEKHTEELSKLKKVLGL